MSQNTDKHQIQRRERPDIVKVPSLVYLLILSAPRAGDSPTVEQCCKTGER